MDDTLAMSPEVRPKLDRCLGVFKGRQPGPLVLCVAAIHGNEQAGLEAARRVLDELETRRPPFRGRFVALAGNLQAIQRNQRYVDKDLNRQWTPERIKRLATQPPAAPDSEDVEQRQLLEAVQSYYAHTDGAGYFLDLHTSSAPGAPFLTVGDTLRNRHFAQQLVLPVVLGLEEQIDGALLEYINNQGHVTVGVEAGQHLAHSSRDYHQAILWLALLAAGSVSPQDVPAVRHYRQLLKRATPGVPHLVEVRHRHVVHPQDGFVMEPGYSNFDVVAAGETLARDRNGPIRTRERCRVLLPLYQDQGDDGFFTVRRISPFWLRVSAMLRRLGVPRLVTLLPGIRTHPSLEETLVVDTRIARIFPLQILHLLGFRKLRWQGNIILVSRRKFDQPPS